MQKLVIKLQEQFDKMASTGNLYVSEVTGDTLWETYLSNFTEEYNPVFRDPESSVHNCNHCRNFIRRYGNIVAIGDDLKLMSIFDVEADSEYNPSMKAMSELLTSSNIADVFVETFEELKGLPYEACKSTNKDFKLGVAINHKEYSEAEAKVFKNTVTVGEVYTFHHMQVTIPAKYISKTGNSAASLKSVFRSNKEVFERGLEELPKDTLLLVIDLIKQGSLFNGDAYLDKVIDFLEYKQTYSKLANTDRSNWLWKIVSTVKVPKFKNELIGVFCSELAEGVELNKAWRAWNKRVDPANFMKATAPITEAQVKRDKKVVLELGYLESFERRLATLEDIKVEEIRHMNIGDGKTNSVSIFDNIVTPSTRHKKSQFEGVEEVSVDKFMKDILPNCTSVELFLENRMENNLVTLTTAKDLESKKMFKWDNHFSWTFKGNLAGKSLIKSAVKNRGGNTEGVLNIRMAFPETTSDYDLHLEEPTGNRINYRNVRVTQKSSGKLDLDAQGVDGHQSPENRVENIIYTDLNKMEDGKYTVSVNDYGSNKFPADCFIEVETDSEVVKMRLPARQRANTYDVCVIKLANGEFTITPSSKVVIDESEATERTIYGIKTQNFHKVNLVCNSPNHWGLNSVGFKHLFFMLEGCTLDETIRSFHSENLNTELTGARKTLERLGEVTRLEPESKSLSGVGFNTTVKDEVILRLKGSHQRVIKVKL